MALNGPAYMGILHMRAAAVEQMDQVRIEGEQIDNNWSAALVDARLSLLDGYWARFQDAQQRLMLEYSQVEVIMLEFNAAEQLGATSYAMAKAKLTELKTARQLAIPQLPRAPRASEIRLSKFNGSYTEWAGWRAEYQAKVRFL